MELLDGFRALAESEDVTIGLGTRGGSRSTSWTKRPSNGSVAAGPAGPALVGR